MLMHEVPHCLRALLLGACCILPLAGCDGGARDAHAAPGGGTPIRQSLAEREARHFDFYMQYRSLFDRPRHRLSDGLQDETRLMDASMRFGPGEADTCFSRGVLDD